MTEDRSLDEFAASDTADPGGGDGEGADGGSDDGESDLDDTDDLDDTNDTNDSEETASPAGEASVSPAVSTSTWSSEGADCERCGGTATRRWRDGDSLVCPDCKEW